MLLHLWNRGGEGGGVIVSIFEPPSSTPLLAPLAGSRSRAAAYRDRRTIVHGFRFYRGKTLPTDLLVCSGRERERGEGRVRDEGNVRIRRDPARD